MSHSASPSKTFFAGDRVLYEREVGTVVGIHGSHSCSDSNKRNWCYLVKWGRRRPTGHKWPVSVIDEDRLELHYIQKRRV